MKTNAISMQSAAYSDAMQEQMNQFIANWKAVTLCMPSFSSSSLDETMDGVEFWSQKYCTPVRRNYVLHGSKMNLAGVGSWMPLQTLELPVGWWIAFD